MLAMVVPAAQSPPASVLRLRTVDRVAIARRLLAFGLTLRVWPEHESIPGSYWGDEEAGLIGATLHARLDTPVHSLFHEACHYICMSPERRAGLDRDAGGDDAEESAVCYLQVLLADELPGIGCERLWQDMDAWGYSFRLGSARRWFEEDATDARQWLLNAGVVDTSGKVTGALRS